MNRRNILSSLGIGITTAIAGCIRDDEVKTGNETELKVASDLSDEEIQARLDEQVEEAYEQRVENGTLVHGHNVDIISVDEISDDSATLETTMSINPENDYTINVHYNPVTVNENGEWVYKNYEDPQYGGVPEYDEDNHEWVSDYDRSKKVQYNFENASPGDLLSSFTVPSEAFWDQDVDLGDERAELDYEDSPQRITKRNNINGYGYSYINEFEFNKTPEMYETFVLTLTWEDENTASPRSGEIVSSTPPMIRVDEDEYLYPRTHDGNNVIDPDWESHISVRSWIARPRYTAQ